MAKKEKLEQGIKIKKKKDGISIHVTIYNTNNLANQGGNAGMKQAAETGGQISGQGGENANQGGQIAAKGGQNANQDGKINSKCCKKAKTKHEKTHKDKKKHK